MAGREAAIERGKAKAEKAGQERAGKDTKGKKGKKSKKGKGADGAADRAGASVAAHPRARQSVRRAKGYGGLGGFALAAVLSHGAGLDLAQLLERSLIVGIVGYVLAGGCAVAVWRHLVLAELRAAIDARRDPAPDALALSPGPGDGSSPPAPPNG